MATARLSSPDAVSPAMAPSLDSTLGAVELAILLSSVLYGVTTMQAYLYLQSPRQDRLWLRGLAAIVWYVTRLDH